MKNTVVNYTDLFGNCELTKEDRKNFFKKQRDAGVCNWVFPDEENSTSHLAYFVTKNGITVVDEKWNEMYTEMFDTGEREFVIL